MWIGLHLDKSFLNCVIAFAIDQQLVDCLLTELIDSLAIMSRNYREKLNIK